jgi:hypothetical protein
VARSHRELEILSILPTMVGRTANHSPGVVSKARDLWCDRVFPVETPASVASSRIL